MIWLGLDYTVHFATVCPGDVAGTICAGKEPLDILFDPLQSQAQPIKLCHNCGYSGQHYGALAAGQFRSQPGDGLTILSRDPTEDFPNDLRIWWYQFNSDFSIEGGEAKDTAVIQYSGDPVLVLASAGPINWLSNTDQVAFAVSNWLSCANSGAKMVEAVGVISFDGEVITTSHQPGLAADCKAHSGALPWLNGMAIGHFASIADDPNSDAAFNLQLATYIDNGHLRIWELDAQSNYQPTLASDITIPDVYPKDRYVIEGPNWLVSGDLQGRSAQLGPPSVLRVSSHSQPSIVLGMPPMHVDYIQPDTSSTSTVPDIVNFTAVPGSFQSAFSMSTTDSNQSSDTYTTSYSYTTTDKSSTNVSLKPPYVPSIKGSITATTEDKHETVSSNYAYQQNEFSYNAATETGFGDEIWYRDNSFNVYIYQVLGETVCPADAESQPCAPDEEQPLYIMFSGPNSSGTTVASGSTTEWYQPLHEPGNIFSYPWDQNQLQLRIGNISILSQALNFYTDDSTQSQLLSWTAGNGSSVTAGSTNSHSQEKGYSLTAGKTVGKILDINVESDINYNNSSSLSTLNQSTSSMGASQGITIDKPGSFLHYQLYQYLVEPYIFGRLPAPQAVDTPTLTETVKTSGPIQAAFVANPLATGSGSWWSDSNNPYANAFDIALNHPVRWTSTKDDYSSSLNCLDSNCMTFNEPDPGNLWNSEFYWMRGLFVTVNGDSGAQRVQATAGDDVFLAARVYNYSFMDMPSGSKIKVRFYRQKLAGTNPSGSSVLIDEVEIDPLVGFNSDSAPATPNWATAETSFDTTGLDNTYHIFWVVAWAEDSGGNLLSELSGHGLNAKPGSLNSIGDVSLEMVTLDGEQKTFSNNVGYLHSKFYIAPAGQQAPAPLDPELSIQNVQVTPSETAPGERVIVSAEIASENAAADAVHVQFFPDAAAWQAHQDDSAQSVPRAFDVELLPHIAAGATDHLEVPYRTTACGSQTVLIVAQSGAQGDTATATASFDNGPCLAYFAVMPVQAP